MQAESEGTEASSPEHGHPPQPSSHTPSPQPLGIAAQQDQQVPHDSQAPTMTGPAPSTGPSEGAGALQASLSQAPTPAPSHNGASSDPSDRAAAREAPSVPSTLGAQSAEHQLSSGLGPSKPATAGQQATAPSRDEPEQPASAPPADQAAAGAPSRGSSTVAAQPAAHGHTPGLTPGRSAAVKQQAAPRSLAVTERSASARPADPQPAKVLPLPEAAPA